MARTIIALSSSLVVATLTATLLAPVVGYSAFVLVYASVAVAAATAGVRGGVATLLLGLLIIQFVVVPRSHAASFEYTHDVFSLIAFSVGSVLIIALAQSMRRIRRRVEIAKADLEVANTDLARANARLAGTLDDANRARQDAVEQAERLRLLNEASRILASSLDYEATVAATARLAVPGFADWCSVDIKSDGEIKQLGAAHIDTPAFRRLRDVRKRSAAAPTGSTALARVIRTGKAEFMPRARESRLLREARNSEHLSVLRELGVRSAMIVPMIARGNIIGALTVLRTRPHPVFDEGSLALAQEVAGRAALAIDNAQLYQKAVAANEAKANFLATMSHELRTPLTAIIGYQELLVEGIAGPVTGTQRHHLDRIQFSARQLLTLIEQVLLYARVDAGAEAIRSETVKAKAVIDEALAVVSPQAHAQRVSLVTSEIDPELTLETDVGKLRQMLINLLDNAVKFTERGSVTIRAFSRDHDVVFEVQDTGIGIAPEKLERIFEAFWQVEQTKTRKAGGTGLGLSTTRQLAKALGGDVSVESTLGVGSTFRITLPKQPR